MNHPRSCLQVRSVPLVLWVLWVRLVQYSPSHLCSLLNQSHQLILHYPPHRLPQSDLSDLSDQWHPHSPPNPLRPWHPLHQSHLWVPWRLSDQGHLLHC